jgi:hypothetical protein
MGDKADSDLLLVLDAAPAQPPARGRCHEKAAAEKEEATTAFMVSWVAEESAWPLPWRQPLRNRRRRCGRTSKPYRAAHEALPHAPRRRGWRTPGQQASRHREQPADPGLSLRGAPPPRR